MLRKIVVSSPPAVLGWYNGKLAHLVSLGTFPNSLMMISSLHPGLSRSITTSEKQIRCLANPFCVMIAIPDHFLHFFPTERMTRFAILFRHDFRHYRNASIYSFPPGGAHAGLFCRHCRPVTLSQAPLSQSPSTCHGPGMRNGCYLK